jgi:DNA-binding response OmpR family regulator
MSPSGAGRFNVLVVDDDEDTSDLLGVVLERRGFHTTRVMDLAQALTALSAGEFSALVTDLTLPDGSGLSLLSNGRPATLRAAVVMSGSAGDEPRRESAMRGFDAYLVKPFDAALLAGLLTKLLEPKENP